MATPSAIPDDLLDQIKTAPVPALKIVTIQDTAVSYREVVADPAVTSRYDVLLLHGMRYKAETWAVEPLWTMQLLGRLGYRAVALALPGYEGSSKTSVANDVYLAAFIAEIKLDRPVIISPSMSGGWSLPYLFKDPGTVLSRARGYVPVAPVTTGNYVQQYKTAQIPSLLIYGEEDITIGLASLKDLKNLPIHTEVKLADAGHACYMNKPLEFHQHLILFLQSL